ncbi:MAG: proteasome subunit beta, partial [Euryarchaeota archaeon]|nr:proteasome subunit beta [Euryarchaeota archaeon]
TPYAIGVLEDKYSADISLEEGIALATQALRSAMKRDSASGEEIEIVTITKDMYKERGEEA